MEQKEIDKLKELYPDLTPEEAMVCIKEFREKNEAGRDYIAEMSSPFGRDNFEEMHEIALSMIIPKFEILKRTTNGESLDISTFYDHAVGLNILTLYDVSSAIQELFGVYNFWLQGEKIYKIHPNLCSRFSATNIRSIPIDLFSTPFKSFKLLLPDNSLHITTYQKNRVAIREIFITDYIESTGDRTIHVLSRSYTDTGFFKITINQTEIHKCVDLSIEDMLVFESLKVKATGKEGEFDDLHQKELRNVFEFIIKTILYITGAGSDVVWIDSGKEIRDQLARAKSTKKIAKLTRRLSKAKKMYLVGHNIVISREEKVMYSGISKGLWKLSYRFIVQGHYRIQHYGEERKQKKLIFIDPFWKGPKYADIVNNPHLVK